MNRRTIGQLASELGVGVETIRFYERRGLIQQPARTGGGYRHYGDDVAAMIRYIRLAQQFGLSLKDVERLKGHLDRGSTFCGVLRQTARNRLDAVAQEIAQLEQLRTDLTAFLNRCDERDQSLPCPILVELGRMEAAVHKSSEQKGTRDASPERAIASRFSARFSGRRRPYADQPQSSGSAH